MIRSDRVALPDYPSDWFVAWYSPKGTARLDDRVRDRVPALSRDRVKDAFTQGRITLSGKPTEAGTRGPGRIEVSVTKDDVGAFLMNGRGGEGFFILYRDEDLILVDKEPGLLSVPTDEGGDPSVLDRLPAFVKGSIFPVHRIDRFTSGIMAFARTAPARRAIIDQFSAHTITRRYLAITRGVPSPLKGTYESYLASDARRVQRSVAKGLGELAITHYQVVEELRGPAAVISVELETGKRNQIRVHFAEAGYPLVGEHRYGNYKDKAFDRQALHAAELELLHPRHGNPVSAAAPLPDDMRGFIGHFRRTGKAALPPASPTG